MRDSGPLTPQPGTQGSLGPLRGRVGLEEGRQEEPHRAQHTHNHKHPQEQPVHHHGHVLPVLHDLRADRAAVTGAHPPAVPPSPTRGPGCGAREPPSRLVWSPLAPTRSIVGPLQHSQHCRTPHPRPQHCRTRPPTKLLRMEGLVILENHEGDKEDGEAPSLIFHPQPPA